MIQLNPINNVLDNIPDNGAIGFRTIVEGSLITELPHTVQNGLNKVNNDRTIPRNAGRETKKENRHTIWNKKNRGG